MTSTPKKTAIAACLAGLFSASTFAHDHTESQQSSKIEVVTVTGQKIQNSLQDTKESVAVFTDVAIEKNNLTDVSDVFQLTPGVVGDAFSFTIRGVNSGSPTQPNRAELASVVFDGVTLSGWAKGEGASQLWDIEQVEVLRGPQSTNIGRNALAGAVVINSKDPVYANEGAVSVGFGNYGRQELKGVANVNIIDNVLALRVAIEDSSADGFIENVTRGEDDYGYDDDQSIRAKLLIEPNDDLRMILSYQRTDSGFGEWRVNDHDYDAKARISTSNEVSRHDIEADILSFKVDYNINDEWDLNSISAYQNSKRIRIDDIDQTKQTVEEFGGIITRNDEDKNFSQELRFNYTGDKLRGSTGIYISKVDGIRRNISDNHFDLVSLFNIFESSVTKMPATGALSGLLTQPNPQLFLAEGIFPQHWDLYSDGQSDVEIENQAIFTEWEYKFDDNWLFTVGARYDKETQTVISQNIAKSDAGLADTFVEGDPRGSFELPGTGMTLNQVITLANVQLSALATNTPRSVAETDFSNFLPHAGLTYSWNDDVSTSFFVKKSYRSGGTEMLLLNGINEFDSEELWNYEFAVRAVVLDGDGVFNANMYYADWEDQQVSVPEPNTSNDAFQMVVNAGASELSGVEVSFDYAVTDELDIFLGGSISKTKYKELNVRGDDLSGNQFANAPEHTAVVGMRYFAKSGYFFTTNVSYTGEVYADAANTNKVKAITLMNVNAGYQMDDLKFEAYAKNALDKHYSDWGQIQASNGDSRVDLGDPREIGARVTYSF
ncbi:TonB-dependent receptor [Pseudoalteromonas luteoviolacea]|uniref:TonB-denpendent receptor n=1 Tax=Pseudoalteromonas luteoviolacea S4054 TaxID=1129367 RepID=A0A0F6A5U0_9GAMM|nr:TonB-dependent receptor [Pseudoalteromonas luteoviolacea]AOT07680.1 hypothetical protein S4054249_07400 [Pseudoalteromonas luteoviolacea]AOT12596.1 hypothetical protein S40542_07400 [Pseudoalteromonas luteoviolacea]AOT17510.1 hypothetical protein S4054_07400 [Pseudoalteromonas luteoviolacea]KKE81216.1 hypothetical protein N479_23325 [Pseudoalteromonas luteoviolacea S4054]KZN66344.1 hypothetical protein N481_24420 [Pseudoalteromonas luteoviolacea S4047-1]